LSGNAPPNAVLEGVVVVCRDANQSLSGSKETGLQIACARLIFSNMSTTIVYMLAMGLVEAGKR
jgi:hypothetical protein